MKYLLLYAICAYVFSMDSTEQLYQQLRTIICDGALDEFRINAARFQVHLTYQDIQSAKRLCDVRLQAIIDLQHYDATDCTGIIVTNFIQKLRSEPHPDQFLANQKIKTKLLANALQRILYIKTNSWQNQHVDREGQWEIDCLQANQCALDR